MLYKALIKKGYKPLTDNIRELLSMMGFDVISPNAEKSSKKDHEEQPDLVVDMVDEDIPYEEFMEIYGGYNSSGIPTILITDTEFNSNLVNNLPETGDIHLLSRPFTYEKLKKAAIPKNKKNDEK